MALMGIEYHSFYSAIEMTITGTPCTASVWTV